MTNTPTSQQLISDTHALKALMQDLDYADATLALAKSLTKGMEKLQSIIGNSQADAWDALEAEVVRQTPTYFPDGIGTPHKTSTGEDCLCMEPPTTAATKDQVRQDTEDFNATVGKSLMSELGQSVALSLAVTDAQRLLDEANDNFTSFTTKRWLDAAAK